MPTQRHDLGSTGAKVIRFVGDDALCPGCAEAIGVDFNEAREEAWIPVFPAEA